jgi:hypothetical protein
MNEPRGRPQLLTEGGPWGFITCRIYRRADQALVLWRSRHHRKGLPVQGPEAAAAAGRRSWLGRSWPLNGWIGLLFALGSLLFASGSLLSLVPPLAARIGLNASSINGLFFLGSIPFTSAAYLQLFQAANAGSWSFRLRHQPSVRHQPRLPRWFGWKPGDLGWLSCALQFPGTLLFNVNTWEALDANLGWVGQEALVWMPDLVGSVLFLASGYLAFIETCHSPWAWQPHSLSWWITFTNLSGCIGFMLSALSGVVLPATHAPASAALSLLFTLLGALGFLIGSLLMLPEAVTPT